MGYGNRIAPYSVIEGDAHIGNNNSFGSFVNICGKVEFGSNNIIGPNVIIGTPPTDTKNVHYSKDPKISIGDGNTIREFCVVEMPTYEEETKICNDAFLMQGVHVSHDCIIENQAVVTNLSVLGGISKILEGADIAMGVTINQYTIIGQYSIAATNSAVMKNVRPFSRYIPNKPISVNYYAIKKYNFDKYTDEIVSYVMHKTSFTSDILVKIDEHFKRWVEKYGHDTY